MTPEDWQVGEVDVSALGLALLLSDLERQTMGAQAWTVTQVAEELAASGRRVWLALGDDGAWGYALTWINGEVSDLQRVVVVPARRRGGVARALLAEVAAAARADGAERMLLEVAESNEAARALYDGAGWKAIDRREKYYGDEAALVWERVL